MAWTYTTRKNKSSGNTGGGGTTATVALASTVAGNFLCIAIGGWNGAGAPTISGVSDSVNGAWTASSFSKANGNPMVALWYLKSGAGGSITVTVTFSKANIDYGLVVAEFSGGDTSSPASGTPVTNSGSGTTATAGSMTPADNDVLVLAAVDVDSYTAVTINAGAEGFTLVDSNEGPTGQPINLVYKIISGAPGTPVETWSFASATWAAGIAAYKPAAGGGGGAVAKYPRGPLLAFDRTSLMTPTVS